MPVALLQSWLQSCVCPLFEVAPPDEPPRDPEPERPPRDEPGPRVPRDPDIPRPREPIGPRGPRVDPLGPRLLGWTEFEDVLAGNGFAPATPPSPSARAGPRPVTRPAGPKVMAQPEALRVLKEVGVTGPEAFLAADREDLAERLGRPVAEVDALARELETFRPFFAPPETVSG
jgi:hypothetical protein